MNQYSGQTKGVDVGYHPFDIISIIRRQLATSKLQLDKSSMEELAALLATLVKNNQQKNCQFTTYPFFLKASGLAGNGVIQQLLPANPNRKFLTGYITNSANSLSYFLFEGGSTTPQQLDTNTSNAYLTRAWPVQSFDFTPAPTNAISLVSINAGEAYSGNSGVLIEGV